MGTNNFDIISLSKGMFTGFSKVNRWDFNRPFGIYYSIIRLGNHFIIWWLLSIRYFFQERKGFILNGNLLEGFLKEIGVKFKIS